MPSDRHDLERAVAQFVAAAKSIERAVATPDHVRALRPRITFGEAAQEAAVALRRLNRVIAEYELELARQHLAD